MKTHSTNYFNTFIAVAEDCPVSGSEIPPVKVGALTAANIQFDMISKNPYKFTSDDVLFQVFADKNSVQKYDYNSAREKFFSKGQPCFRASPLTKRYGWGVHYDENGKIAIFGIDSVGYATFLQDISLKQLRAMKSAR